ncbi:hypothetical protein [Streptomyces acidiscabies]|uniref:hypothetical protein n=1 Tax=Streptomyces acidiscabies TaxID=42234 RepID=UPI0038F6D004
MTTEEKVEAIRELAEGDEAVAAQVATDFLWPRCKDQDGFAVLAKRWRVERAISWIMRARRNVRDYERLISHSEAHITWTSSLMTRRLTKPPRPPRSGPHPVEPPKKVVTPVPIRLRKKARMLRLAPAALS